MVITKHGEASLTGNMGTRRAMERADTHRRGWKFEETYLEGRCVFHWVHGVGDRPALQIHFNTETEAVSWMRDGSQMNRETRTMKPAGVGETVGREFDPRWDCEHRR
jgi:hypothetical protein